MLGNDEERLNQLSVKFQIGKGLNPDEHIKMLNQVENLPKEQAVELFNYFLTKETNPSVLLYIVRTLGKLNDKSSAEPLVEMLLWKETYKENLKDPESYLKVRCMAANVLGNIKNNDAVLPLLYVLNNKDENYKLRLSAAEALGRIGDKYAVAPLIEVVSDEEEKSVYLRESAAKALGMIGDSRAIDPLVSILEAKKGIVDKFTFLKERVIEALARLGFKDDRTIKALKNALADEASYVRLCAVEALSEIEDERVIPLIEKMINDEEEDVARGAINALYIVAGEEFIVGLLKRDDLPGWCRDEIDNILDETLQEESDYE